MTKWLENEWLKTTPYGFAPKEDIDAMMAQARVKLEAMDAEDAQ